MSNFSSNWFDNLAKHNFEDIIKPIFLGKDIKYLEIGCFEGASLLYMFENVLTNDKSTATVIDPFIFYKNQFDVFNLNMKPYSNKINLLKGYSKDILPTLNKESFDFIYIDGDHTSECVFNDAILSFPLLKKDGIIIFDDYLWRHNGNHDMVNTNDINLLHPNNPFSGINKFLDIYKDRIEIIKQNWQMIIKKYF